MPLLWRPLPMARRPRNTPPHVAFAEGSSSSCCSLLLQLMLALALLLPATTRSTSSTGNTDKRTRSGHRQYEILPRNEMTTNDIVFYPPRPRRSLATASADWERRLVNETNGTEHLLAPYECEQLVHDRLFGEESMYSSAVPPISRRVGTGPERGDREVFWTREAAALNVSLGITYYHVRGVSTKDGTAEVDFGIDMKWTDERLRWDPASVGGCYQTSARASLDVEKTQIWVPDFDLMNRVLGVQSWPDAKAMVFADGTVRWWRLGGLRAICAFTGLERFPYDSLGCFFSFGSLLPVPVGYIPWEDGEGEYVEEYGGDDSEGGNATIFSINDEFPAKYQEYILIKERSFGAWYNNGRDFVVQLYFRRASRFYTHRVVLPTIIFTMLSFGLFLLDVRIGERLAFGEYIYVATLLRLPVFLLIICF